MGPWRVNQHQTLAVRIARAPSFREKPETFYKGKQLMGRSSPEKFPVGGVNQQVAEQLPARWLCTNSRVGLCVGEQGILYISSNP